VLIYLLHVKFQDQGHHLKPETFMEALNSRDVMLRAGMEDPWWWLTLPIRYQHICVVEIIREQLKHRENLLPPPERTEKEQEYVIAFRSIRASAGLANQPDFVTLPYRHWNRAHLEQIVHEKNQWLEGYAGASCLHLAYDFIEMVIANYAGIATADFKPFVTKMCHILENTCCKAENSLWLPFKGHDGSKGRILYHGLHCMKSFLHTLGEPMYPLSMMRDVHRNSGTYDVVGKPMGSDVNDFSKNLFGLLVSRELERDTLFLIWALLQAGFPCSLFHHFSTISTCLFIRHAPPVHFCSLWTFFTC
jgi:hypothetical protein